MSRAMRDTTSKISGSNGAARAEILSEMFSESSLSFQWIDDEKNEIHLRVCGGDDLAVLFSNT